MFFKRKDFQLAEAERNNRTWTWKQRFAFWPVQVEEKNGIGGFVFLEFYESRSQRFDTFSTTRINIERRRIGSRLPAYRIEKFSADC